MSPNTVLIRFPDGTKQWRYGESELQVGDFIWHDGEYYRIVELNPDAGGPWHAKAAVATPSIGDIIRSEDGEIAIF